MQRTNSARQKTESWRTYMDTPNPAASSTQNTPDTLINRRTFLAGAAAATALTALGSAAAQPSSVDEIPVIDAHIHLFDGTRPLGAEYMGSPAYQAISKTSLPSMYSQ